MASKDPFQTVGAGAFYHFTDKRNLPKIRETGGLFSIAILRERGIVVPKPGGNQWSHDADTMYGLDRYVHLCFRNSHPMEWRARQNGHIGETVFLEIDPEVRHLKGVMYSPGVSNKSGVPVLPLNDAIDSIDFEVLYTKTDWRDPAIKARLKVAGKCELLVPDHVPSKYIRNLTRG